MLVFCPTVGANVLGWSLGKKVLLGCVLASKRADSASKRLTKLGTARGWTCKATPTLNIGGHFNHQSLVFLIVFGPSCVHNLAGLYNSAANTWPVIMASGSSDQSDAPAKETSKSSISSKRRSHSSSSPPKPPDRGAHGPGRAEFDETRIRP
ncbi:hypothetical protein PIB30_011941 [Stylosanthes scabra]|uniref:Uncharacterized protein n=1 Tax=Stylosanthes scabra TaxID=79078 RepID=A0ABU6W7S8_9FABA|nr:hypothetical protein [Stylosanthes scabra]